jgi:hypothetical protein
LITGSSKLTKREAFMIFIVTGYRENGPVSVTCNSGGAALERARALLDQGVRDILIDADGHEYAPGDFKRLFVEPGLAGASIAAVDFASPDE